MEQPQSQLNANCSELDAKDGEALLHIVSHITGEDHHPDEAGDSIAEQDGADIT